MSLATEMALVSVFALAAAIVFYIILSITADAALNKIFDTEQFYRKCDQRTIESLEKYVRENDIKSDDWYMLNRWVKDGNAISSQSIRMTSWSMIPRCSRRIPRILKRMRIRALL